MLKDLRQHFGRRRDAGLGQLLSKDLSHPDFVRGVCIGVDEADGNSRRSALLQQTPEFPGFVFVEFSDDVAGVVDAFSDLESVTSANVGAGDVRICVPQIVFRAVADFDDIAKSFGRHHRRFGESTSDERIGCNGGSVREEFNLTEVDVGALHSVENSLHRVLRGRRYFRHPHFLGGFVENADIGERSADVDCDA